jgi:hypothetical protein
MVVLADGYLWGNGADSNDKKEEWSSVLILVHKLSHSLYCTVACPVAFFKENFTATFIQNLFFYLFTIT